MSVRSGFRTRRVVGLAAAGAVGATMAFGAAERVEAQSVNELLLQVASEMDLVGESVSYRFRDRDWGVLLASDGSTVKTGTDTFNVGDIVRGSLIMEGVSTTSGTSANREFGQDGNFLFAQYSLEIVSLGDNNEVRFGADPNNVLGDDASNVQTMVRFVESSNDPGLNSSISSVNQDNHAGFHLVQDVLENDPDASVWATAGMTSDGDLWNYNATPAVDNVGVDPSFEVGQWYAAPDGDQLAGTVSGEQTLSWILGPDLAAFGHLIAGFEPRWQTATSFSIIGDNNPEVFRSDGTVQAAITVIPLPAAAWGGMALLGLLGVGRFARRGLSRKA